MTHCNAQNTLLTNPLILLKQESIKEHLRTRNLTTPFKLHLFTSIDSTNRFLKDLPLSTDLEICCAETQTQGRGRFGRYWYSPFGENIYCSSRWNLPADLTKLSGLSLISSLATLATLKEFKLPSELKIKWPNDIYWTEKKLCGILIELITESNNSVQVIIGIGLNVNNKIKQHPLPDKPWCSLYEITHQYFDRNLIIAQLISNLEHYIHRFLDKDLEDFMDEWNQADYLAGKSIQLTHHLGHINGTACGVNHLGQLILEDESGIKHAFSSGDTSTQAALF
jgi:BirA family biotin operon repressor/biotin-[acetyl-CoA-carboxylase] ligase